MLLTVDSSVYLSALLAHDPFHRASVKFLKKVHQKKADIILPILIPLEVANTLWRQNVNLEKVKTVYHSFRQTPRHQIVDLGQSFSSLLIETIERFNLKTADWIIAQTAFHSKSRLITWDLPFLEKTKALLGTQTPEEWMRLSSLEK